ncbi:hypothetical protein MNB_SV-5-1266 [hydrothermal vent metagenome]|uniref:Multidrug resistance protein (Efflux pump/antiporter) n=1 Tax=hydrothermal vent metagenome TaxID=652676 RepID=A0A1W1ED00_9ZZZZ
MKITLKSNKIIQFLSTIAIILILLNTMMLIGYFYIDNPKEFDFVQMVDLDQEANLPTLFSSALLLISAFLFYLLSKKSQILQDTSHLYWLGLSIVFVFLGFDESAKIHETLGDWTEQYVDASGYIHYPWVISYSIFVVILGFFYLRFFLKMERKVFWSFMKSAAIFLTGAIGFELLGANEASLHGSDTMLYCYYYTIEESLEMFGVIYLIGILLKLLDGNKIQIN